MHQTLYLYKCHPHCSSRPDFVFPMLYGVSVRLSTYMKPSSSLWKGWVNHLHAFHISMRLVMILAVGCTVLGIDWELESDWDIVELPEFICFWVLCRTEESVQNNSIFCIFLLVVTLSSLPIHHIKLETNKWKNRYRLEVKYDPDLNHPRRKIIVWFCEITSSHLINVVLTVQYPWSPSFSSFTSF